MAAKIQPPNLPSVPDTGTLINASGSDWRAILIAVMFLFIAMIVFVVWREILGWKMAKSLDKVSEALVALRIVIVEAIAERKVRDHIQDARDAAQDARQKKQDEAQ